jgi:hypothetical protein
MFLYITRQKVGQKYLGSFEMWCRGTIENVSWTDNVGNEEILVTDRNTLQTVKRRKANWNVHIL